MPWSTLLRTRCTSGSPIFSSTVLSSSVCSPESCSSIFLPSRFDRSRTRRGKRLNTVPTGNMRTRMTLSCSSRMFVSSCARPDRSRSACMPSKCLLSWLSIDWVITISPTVFSSSSIFSMATRIELTSVPAAALAGAARAAGAAGVAATATGATSGAATCSVGTGAATGAGAGAAAVTGASNGWMSSSQSPSAHSNISSMALRGASVVSSSCQEM